MRHDPSTDDLIRRTLAGERLALSRAISWVENEAPGATELIERCYEKSGRAFRIGITGPPGAGKSTLVARMARVYRDRGQTVAIVAVGPTSPFSGGALLGDRVRMGELAGDEGVFIRSMATRGSMGGLAVHTAQVCDLLDAAGFERIVIETVGVGQSELEVAQTADSTAVVLVPESGDGIQAMKAGLMEIGDLFVVNKADREGAERSALAVRSALGLKAARPDWDPPVLLAAAVEGRGVDEVVEAFEAHCGFLRERGDLDARRRRRWEQQLVDILRDRMWRQWRERLPEAAWAQAVSEYVARRVSPHQAARAIGGSALVAAASRDPREAMVNARRRVKRAARETGQRGNRARALRAAVRGG